MFNKQVIHIWSCCPFDENGGVEHLLMLLQHQHQWSVPTSSVSMSSQLQHGWTPGLNICVMLTSTVVSLVSICMSHRPFIIGMMLTLLPFNKIGHSRASLVSAPQGIINFYASRHRRFWYPMKSSVLAPSSVIGFWHPQVVIGFRQ